MKLREMGDQGTPIHTYMYCTRVKLKSQALYRKTGARQHAKSLGFFWGWVRAVKYNIQSVANRLQPGHMLKNLLEAKFS